MFEKFENEKSFAEVMLFRFSSVSNFLHSEKQLITKSAYEMRLGFKLL